MNLLTKIITATVFTTLFLRAAALVAKQLETWSECDENDRPAPATAPTAQRRQHRAAGDRHVPGGGAL